MIATIDQIAGEKFSDRKLAITLYTIVTYSYLKLHYILKFRYNAHPDCLKRGLYESIKHSTKAVAPPTNSLF